MELIADLTDTPRGRPSVRRLAILLLAGLAVFLGALAPSTAVAQDEFPGPGNPTIITGGTVTPSSLNWEGGQVDVVAKRHDDYGLSMV